MILIAPLRLMTLHFSQIGFTEALTFILNPPFATYLPILIFLLFIYL